MPQEITVTNVGDHHEMAFDGGNSYPVPTNAIDNLDDDLTPEEEGESVTFVGDYGGHKHCKTFDVEEVVDGLGDEDEEAEAEPDEETEETGAEPTPEHVAEVGYHTAAGQAQQAEAQRLFADNGGD